MAVIAVVLSALSLLISITTLVLLLTLPYRSKNSYPGVSRRLAGLEDHVATELGRLAASQSALFRYVEAINDGQPGPEVLHRRVRANEIQHGPLGDH